MNSRCGGCSVPSELLKPERHEPAETWEHYAVWKAVGEVLEKLPLYFKSTISVSGVNATELYTFSAVLGSTIEQEVVRTLNNLKPEWDTLQKYTSHRFVRQPQTFPDVLLRTSGRSSIILGIELKSWYLLAKEGEPSFRFTVTPGVCAPQDFLVIVPWVLSNVLSGTPLVLKPFAASSRYIAEYRNYWWQNSRKASKSVDIQSPREVSYYPAAREEISDKAIEDKGKNFGRIARLGIMDEYIQRFEHHDLLGLEVATWRKFFKEKVLPEIVEEDDDSDL